MIILLNSSLCLQLHSFLFLSKLSFALNRRLGLIEDCSVPLEWVCVKSLPSENLRYVKINIQGLPWLISVNEDVCDGMEKVLYHGEEEIARATIKDLTIFK